MRVWKFIWLRPIPQAAVVTALLVAVIAIRGSSNAQGIFDWIERSLEVFAIFYVIFVLTAALAWRKAVPVENPEQLPKS